MNVELLVALIAGAIALATACMSVVSAIYTSRRTSENELALEKVKQDFETARRTEDQQRQVSTVSEPLARSAYDLQSRLYNILKQGFAQIYLRGTEREKGYVVNNTVFLVAQYFCWTEIARREIQFIDLGRAEKTRRLVDLQDEIYGLWSTDGLAASFRIFAGEQRAIGEALVQPGLSRPECLGYGAFLKAFPQGANELLDSLREDVRLLEAGLSHAAPRLIAIQHALIELLDLLDPENIRFPEGKRDKV